MASWDNLALMLPRSAVHSRKCLKRGKKPGEVPGFRWTRSPFSQEEERENSPKIKEQSGNVYENKGPAFRSPFRSWNVIENKSSYALKPGILLKTSMLAVDTTERTLR
jgi:hypothetical protein